MSNLRKLFDHFDIASDNTMSLGDLRLFCQTLSRLNPTFRFDEAAFRQYFAYAEANREGRLEFAELLRVLSQAIYNGDAQYAALKARFAAFDADKDERLTPSELQSFFVSAYTAISDARFTQKESVLAFFLNGAERGSDRLTTFDEFYLYLNGALRAE